MFKKNINKNLKFSIYLVITIIITLCFSISIQSLLAAWTYPTASPPSGNVSGLLNEGINDQTKLGGLTIGGAFKADSIDNTLVVDAVNNRVGIGTIPSAGLKLEVAGTGKFSDIELNGDIQAINFIGNGSSITNLNASNLSTGIVANARLDADLQDLADGSLTGSKVGAGISGDNIVNGTIDSSEIQNGSLTYSDTNVNSIQRRVIGTCAAGSSIRVISSTGGVTCETDNTGITSESDTLQSVTDRGRVTSRYIQSNSSMRAPRFYDSDNTIYYVNPNSTSKLSYIYTNKIYDEGNTNYYLDPAGTSRFRTINLGGVSKSAWPSGGVTFSHTDCYWKYPQAAYADTFCNAGYYVAGIKYIARGSCCSDHALYCCRN